MGAAGTASTAGTGATRPAGPPSPGALRGFLHGVGLLGRGLALYARAPKLLLLGLIPVFVAALLFAAGLVTLAVFISDLATAATWFADDLTDPARALIRLLAGVAIFGVALLVTVVTFTAVALAIGDPFYERISRQVEQWCGGVTDEVATGWWRSLWQGLADFARVLAITVSAAVVLLLAGYLPVVGQTVVPVVGALIAGWFLAVELVGITFSRRGFRLRDRWRALRGHRATAVGFGTAVFVCFLVPGGAVLVMPAAVAGGTLLARTALGLPAVLPPRPRRLPAAVRV